MAREALKGANDKKLTQDEFAKRINYSRNSVSKWENSAEQIPEGAYQTIRDAYGINPEWLREGREPMFIKHVELAGESNNQGIIDKLRVQTTAVMNKSHQHPGISVWAYAGMGGGYFDPDERTEPMERIEAAHLLSLNYQNAFRAWGQSMMPVIRHNALCFCDFRDREVRGGEIYAFNLPSSGLVIKELRILKEFEMPVKYIIYSYNEAQYAPEYYSKEELAGENFIVGRITLIHMETNK